MGCCFGVDRDSTGGGGGGGHLVGGGTAGSSAPMRRGAKEVSDFGWLVVAVPVVAVDRAVALLLPFLFRHVLTNGEPRASWVCATRTSRYAHISRLLPCFLVVVVVVVLLLLLLLSLS